MKKFVFKLSCFIMLLIIAELLIISFPSPRSLKNSLYFSKIDKDSLLKFERDPRIIFVGGSNLSFGLNSQLIKDSLGLNPINTGLHANLGLVYMMNEALRYIKKGDLVVLIPEYENFFDEYAYGAGGYELLVTTLEVTGKYLELQPKQIIGSLPYFSKYTRAKINPLNYISKVDTNDIYSRSSFNEFGDAKNHWNINTPPSSYAPNSFGSKFNHSIVPEILNFKSEVEQKGATTLFSFPCIQKTNSITALNNIRSVKDEMKKSGITLLGNPEIFMFPNNQIFNSTYHLSKIGADIRTNMLISQLKDYANCQFY